MKIDLRVMGMIAKTFTLTRTLIRITLLTMVEFNLKLYLAEL